MYSKIEFILYSAYTPATKTNAEITGLASAIYTDLYDCDMSALKTLGNTDYFGNEPRSFDFELDYDSWLESNIIAETNDIAKSFSKYIVRIYDNDVYVFSGVLELSYFKIDYSKNKVKLKAYDWLVLINKIKSNYFQYRFDNNNYVIAISNIINKAIFDIIIMAAEDVSQFAEMIICYAQSLIFGGFAAGTIASNILTATIKPYSNITNIISSLVESVLFSEQLFFETDSTGILGLNYRGGLQIGTSGNVCVCITYFSHWTQSDNGNTYTMYRSKLIIIEYIGSYVVLKTEKNYYGKYSERENAIIEMNNLYNLLLSNTTYSALYSPTGDVYPNFLQTITDDIGQIYNFFMSPPTYNSGGSGYDGLSVLYPVLRGTCFSNSGAVKWKTKLQTDDQEFNIPINAALKIASVAGNGAFVITNENPDEIKFISKYIDSGLDFINIADDDICDDLQFSRVSKQEIQIEDIENNIDSTWADTLINNLKTYYDKFFVAVNTKSSFSISNLFTNYDLKITDKIIVLDDSQVINSIKKDSEYFTKIESMNYLMDKWIDEIAIPNTNYFVDELGNHLIFPSYV